MFHTTTRVFFAMIAIVALAACARHDETPAIKVTVDDRGFSPSTLTLAKSQPARLEFTRTSDETCAREVVFLDLGIKEDLPLGKPVTVTLPAGDARTYRFQCGMGMFKGSVVAQ